MEYYENTTRITEDGYVAIVRMKRLNQRIVCLVISLLLAIPFLLRCVYFLILRLTTDQIRILSIMDGIFVLLLLAAIWLGTLPNRQIKNYIQRTRHKMDLQAVNQYIFFPESITMMTTSSLEKFQLFYDDLTWMRCDKNWMVLYFEKQNFTMLVDKRGFTKGNADNCRSFLQEKMGKMR